MDLRDIKEFFRDCLGYILSLIIIIIIFTFIIAFHPVAGNSMVPTLEEGSVTVVAKSHHVLFGLKRKQVVIVKKDKKTYIKRVIGLPGEEIHYLDNTLYVNGAAVEENYLGEDATTNSFMLEDVCDSKLCPKGIIPDDYYLVLGDNRNDSIDSRDPSFGMVKKSEIKGIVIFNIWPIDNFGKIKK